MLYKNFLMMSVCIVFSCAGMETASQETVSREIALQSCVHNVHLNENVFRVAATKALSRYDSERQQLIQGVASLSRDLHENRCDFSQADELIQGLRRSLYPHEQNTLVKGSSPRVLSSVDSSLEKVQKILHEARHVQLCPGESDDVRRTLVKAKLIYARRLFTTLCAILGGKESSCCGNEVVATKHTVVLDPKSPLLVSVEALECFSQATDDTASLCASCKNCPQDRWCGVCKSADRAHSPITPFMHTVARETEIRIGVNDALWYLESRVGVSSGSVDQYALDGTVKKWQGSEDLQVLADMRKFFLQLARMHKDLVEDARNNPGPRAGVAQQQVNVPAVGGVFEGLVTGLCSWNPLTLLQAKAGSLALTRTLGIDEKHVPQLGEILGSLSRISGFDKDSTFWSDSLPDVERFVACYKKPMREQLLSSECCTQFEALAHAWKTAGIDVSGLRLIVHPKNRATCHKPKQKKGKKVVVGSSQI